MESQEAKVPHPGLVLTRKKGEAIVVADGLIKFHVIEVRGDKVRIRIEAPADVRVDRMEVFLRREAIANQVAVS